MLTRFRRSFALLTLATLVFSPLAPGVEPARASVTITYLGNALTKCEQNISGSSGSVTVSLLAVGNEEYCVLDFKNTGNLGRHLDARTTFDTPIFQWAPPQGISSVDYLLVAGGGGGGGASSNLTLGYMPGGGGGAGGVVSGSQTGGISESVSVVVGYGGNGAPGDGSTSGSWGGPSAISWSGLVNTSHSAWEVWSREGGPGQGRSNTGLSLDGGSGGGGAHSSSFGLGTAGQGNNGGKVFQTASPFYKNAGGGGGFGSAAEDGTSQEAGNGGSGGQVAATAFGNGEWFAGGGGGGAAIPGTTSRALGGSSIGGNGGIPTSSELNATPPTADTGSGGGGGAYFDGTTFGSGSKGSAGRVFIRYLLLNPQAELTVTSTSGTFGTPLQLVVEGGTTGGAITYSVTGGTASDCSVTAAGSLTSSSSGTCAVTATMEGDAEYAAVSSAVTTVTFAKLSRTITFAATEYTIAYGNTQTVIATPSEPSDGTSDGAVTYSVGSSTACTFNPSTREVIVTQASGTCEITATVEEGTNYFAATTTTPVVVTTATRPLTFTASSASVDFGNTFSTNALTSGLINNDTIASATYIYVGTGYGPSTTMPTDAGIYSVTPSAAVFSAGSASNYNITYVGGSVEIRKVTRTLSFGTTSATLAFGDSLTLTANPSAGAGDGTVTYTTSSPGCSLNSTTGVVSANDSSGSCVISASITEGTNYLAASTTTSFTVTLAKRSISIKAADLQVGFGDQITATYQLVAGTSLPAGDSILEVTFTFSGTAPTVYAGSTTAPTNVGTYSITPSAADFSADNEANYVITYLTGTLTITKRNITITPTTLTLALGETVIPTFTVTAGSLLAGDVISGATFSFVGSGTTIYASSTEAPTGEGTYTVTPSVAAFSAGNLSNYEITYAPATLTITKRNITITPTTLTVTVGATITPTFTVTVGSLIAGDVISGVTFTFEGSGSTDYDSSTEAPTAVGTYTVTPSDVVFSTGDHSNYEISYATATLTIQTTPPPANINRPSAPNAAAPVPPNTASPQSGMWLAANRTAVVRSSPLVVSIRGGVGLGAVTIRSLTPNICRPLDNSRIATLNDGNCRLVATKAGDGTHPPQTTQVFSFEVMKPFANVRPMRNGQMVSFNLGEKYANQTVRLQIKRSGSNDWVTVRTLKLTRTGVGWRQLSSLRPGDVVRVMNPGVTYAIKRFG